MQVLPTLELPETSRATEHVWLRRFRTIANTIQNETLLTRSLPKNRLSSAAD
jgi:hypothetical protein